MPTAYVCLSKDSYLPVTVFVCLQGYCSCDAKVCRCLSKSACACLRIASSAVLEAELQQLPKFASEVLFHSLPNHGQLLRGYGIDMHNKVY